MIAHRGDTLHGDCENSVAAIRKAHKHGADYIEVDIRLNGQGSFVALHDKTVDRTTKASGYIHEMSDAEVRDVVTNCDGYIPFLARICDVMREECPGMHMLLDIKEDPLGRWSPQKFGELRDVLVANSMGHRSVIFTWDEGHLAASLSVAPNTRTCLIGAPNRPPVEEAAKHWAVTAWPEQIDPEYVQALREVDTKVICRNTVIREEWAWVRSCGGWGTMTDDLDAGIAWR